MNSVPLLYRLLLIALLPAIAAVLYIKGQKYDPALIDFKAMRQETSNSAQPLQAIIETATAPVAAGISGFKQFGRPHNYTKENLYEHVDGHAEYFIGMGFVSLTVTEYIAADSRSATAETQAEIFDMGKSIHAFGVLADESGENPAPVSVGDAGYKTSGGVNFIKGRHYVKVSALDPKASAVKFAKALAETLPSGKDAVHFARLPNIGKTVKTRFIKEGYRGLDFLHNVIEREYSTGGKKVTVALITGNEREVQSVMSSFHSYFSKSGIPNEKSEMGGKEFYKVMDKYEGNWLLIPSKDAIFGIFGTGNEEIVRHFVKQEK